MDIDHWRKEIDDIDAELLRLLNMRARLAMKVGALKQAAQIPFCDPDRERTSEAHGSSDRRPAQATPWLLVAGEAGGNVS